MAWSKKHQSGSEFDVNIKLRRYSSAVMGYRVIIDNEAHYIINSALSKADRWAAAEVLLDLGSEFTRYGLVILQEGFRLHADPDYVYDFRTGKHEFRREYKIYTKKAGF